MIPPHWGGGPRSGGGGKNHCNLTYVCYFAIMHKYKGNLINFARSNRRAGNLAEALLWNKLKQDKLGFTFTRQKPIGNYIADFYCPAKKLVIEIDGFTHGTKYEYDHERDAYMESLGIRVIRITDHDVKRNMSNVLYWIKYNLEN